MKRFLRRSWFVTAAVAAVAAVFALTALAGGGLVTGGTTLTYTAAAGEVNHVTVSVSAGNVVIDDPTGGVTALGGCTGTTQLTCGPLTALTAPMVINVGDANDSVTIAASVNSTIPSITIIGGTGNDTLTNNSNRQVTFIGGPGNDTLTGNGHDDTADYSSSPSGVNVDLGAGTATGDGSDTLANIGNVIGSSHDDTLAGDDLANDLQGGPGNDTVDYSGVTSTSASGITLTLGVPLIVPGTTNAGADTLGGIENVTGSHYGDSITGDAGPNTIDGNGGADSTLDGGAGTDTLSYASSPAAVSIDLGTPVQTNGDVVVTNSFERLTGSSFDDSLRGDGGNNILNGGGGNDALAGGGGDDTLNGGAGSNTADYSAAAAAVTASIVGGGTSGGADGDGGTDTYVNVQNLTGSGQGDTLTGDDAPNTINGNGGADAIDGGLGDDTLNGGPGSGDSIVGGQGNDTIDGGGGINDSVSYAGSVSSAATDGVRVNLGGSAPQATAIGTNDAGNDTIVPSSVENVTGSPFADSLTGDGNSNALIGSGGNDTFGFSGGNDDSFDGGTGTNSADFSADPGTVTLNLTTVDVPQAIDGVDNLTIASSGGLSTIQNVTGSPQNDVLSGDAQMNSLSGGGGSDTVNGGGDNDTINGDAGNDVLLGSSGDDSLDGGIGNDTIAGNVGTDALSGGSGTNTADYGTAAAAVSVDLRSGTAGNDGDGGSDTLSGFQNVTAPGIAGNALQGDAGNNVLDAGGAGGATVLYTGAAGGVTVDLGAGLASGDGNDTLIGGFATVVGSAFGDTLTAAPAGSTLNGAPGNDTLLGRGGNDSLNGGTGDDSLNGLGGTNTLDGGSGIDTADYSGVFGATVDLSMSGFQFTGGGTDSLSNVENLIGSAAADTLSGNLNDNAIVGGGGGDTLRGNGGDDSLDGQAGDDTLNGGSGDDALAGGTGSDSASFAGGNAVSASLTSGVATGQGTDSLSGVENLTGSANNDSLTGDAGNNTLDGGLGNDSLDGAAGNDSLAGGGGVDTADYSGSALPVNATLGAPGTATGQGNDSLSSIANLVGSNGNDTLTGDPGDNTLSGLGGDDSIAGGGGNDTLDGGNGNDTISQTGLGSTVENGGVGADTLNGGPGTDAVNGGSGDDSLSGGSGVNTLDGGTGTDTADYSAALNVPIASLGGNFALATWPAGVGSDSLVNLENVNGSPGADTIIGDGSDNVLRGLGANDFIRPAGGDDSVQGGNGTDTVDFQDAPGGVSVNLTTGTGSALGFGTVALTSIENVNGSGFADQLSGNGGPNTLSGAAGNDQIDGGGGADVLDGGANDDTIFARDGFVDTIVCGAGNDSASVDPIDTVNSDCEIAGFLSGPVVQTFEATGITTTAATLNGSVNPDGRAVTYFFRYGLTQGYGSTTASAPLPAGHTPLLVSAAISGLAPGTTYHYQLVVTDTLGNVTAGNDQAFTTGVPANPGPTALTLPASPGDAPPHDATLLGRVTTNGVPTTYFFEYGLTTAYGQQTAAQQLGSTSIPVLVWDYLTGLKSKTTYHFRLVATNQVGTSYGADNSLVAPFKSTTLSITTLRAAKSAAGFGRH